jgi:hypothetical protein
MSLLIPFVKVGGSNFNVFEENVSSSSSSYKFCPFLWKLLVFEFLLGISETLLSSISAHHVKIVLLLDALQVLILFTGTSVCLEPKLFFLNLFNSHYFFLLKY